MSYLNSEKLVKVSVIIPLYYGEKYVDGLYTMCKKSLDVAGIFDRSEIIFVNDSPSEKVDVGKYANARLVCNLQNQGIHKSKINGLNEAKGRYIHFLDQDDKIESNFYKSQLDIIKDSDIAVCNAIMEHKNYERVLYRSKFALNMVKRPSAYAYIDNRVESLGQCLIRKSSIPLEWICTQMRINGADDMFLLLLLFEYKCKFEVNAEVLYRHTYTSTNLSLDTENMLVSVKEVAELLMSVTCDSRIAKILSNKVMYKTQKKITFDTFLFFLIDSVRELSRKIRG